MPRRRARPSSSRYQETPEPARLLSWMDRLYQTTVDPRNTLVGELGVWPVEMRDMLELIVRAHAPTLGEWLDPPALTFAEGLLLPPKNTSTASIGEKTAWLFFSGGKDAMAQGVLLERAGYRVHAIYVTTLNRSYPNEGLHAKAIADELGWRFGVLVPRLPEVYVKPRGISVVRNPFMVATALEQLCEEQHEALPSVYAFGSYSIDDCHCTSHVMDFEACYRAAHTMLQTLYKDAWPARFAPLADPLEAYRVWREMPHDVRALTSSCMMPVRNKPLHRRQSAAQGVPMLEYECTHCYKCCEKAVLLSERLGLPEDDPPYPAAYLTYAKARILTLLHQPLSGTHAHPSLETPYLKEIGYPGNSMHYLWHVVYGGILPGEIPEANTNSAAEVSVTVARQEKQSAPDLQAVIRDRILRLEKVPASQLVPSPDNWREHPEEQRQALGEILTSVGLAGVELVRELPDGRYGLIDGHLRQEWILEHGDQAMPVVVTDLDADEAKAVLATFDPISRMATFDHSKLQRLIEDLQASTHAQMAGILQSVAQQAEQMRVLAARAAAANGVHGLPLGDRDITDMGEEPSPEVGAYDDEDAWDADDDPADGVQPKRSMELKQPKDGELGSGYRLYVECQSEAEQERAWELLTREGFQCRVLTL